MSNEKQPAPHKIWRCQIRWIDSISSPSGSDEENVLIYEGPIVYGKDDLDWNQMLKGSGYTDDNIFFYWEADQGMETLEDYRHSGSYAMDWKLLNMELEKEF